MKKSILNIGKALDKSEQKTINGGNGCAIPIDPRDCSACGGFSFGDCCLGDAQVWLCLGY